MTPTRLARAGIAMLVTVTVGCGASGPPAAPPPPVTLPDLTPLAASVQQQIRTRHAALERLRPGPGGAALGLFLDHAPETGRREVPDPYYEGGFDLVLDLIEAASDGLIAALREGR